MKEIRTLNIFYIVLGTAGLKVYIYVINLAYFYELGLIRVEKKKDLNINL
ncbi:hypothetical protein BCM20_000901 [Clostridium beijerinckii]|uniref:Uncharacterized protein n=1 Tax=Clostridium beijerinckii TaxID=1520 RepID=A0AAX0B825_CLOBE|nr:hypothetical protein [Clostridium beijerinckii]MBA8933123.1 hypothetical protein [Clostridium beijerinckii]NOW05910.1 hypothetical protein [Clostridium beijerinckii]NRT36928.1 hypothetical protein [Clostridium beijerinckii]NRT43638.1 hypothetical protein [Clostridium beijerinckii]NRT91545.1 hypothetical protein [Clostridium beijerinckii]